MTRTWRTGAKNQGATGGTSTPDTRPFNPSGGYPGRKTKGALCQMNCENLATGTMDVGLPYKVRVCDRAVCRDAARRLKGDDDG